MIVVGGLSVGGGGFVVTTVPVVDGMYRYERNVWLGSEMQINILVKDTAVTVEFAGIGGTGTGPY